MRVDESLVRATFAGHRNAAREFLALDLRLELYVQGVSSSETRAFRFTKSAGDMIRLFSPVLDAHAQDVIDENLAVGKSRRWTVARGRWIRVTPTSVELGVHTRGAGDRPDWDGGTQLAVIAVLHECFSHELEDVVADRSSDSGFEDLGSVKKAAEAQNALADLAESTARIDFAPIHPDGGVNPFIRLKRHSRTGVLQKGAATELCYCRTGSERPIFMRPGVFELYAEAGFTSYKVYSSDLSQWARQAICVSATERLEVAPFSRTRLACTPNDLASEASQRVRAAVYRRDLSGFAPVEGFSLRAAKLSP